MNKRQAKSNHQGKMLQDIKNRNDHTNYIRRVRVQFQKMLYIIVLVFIVVIAFIWRNDLRSVWGLAYILAFVTALMGYILILYKKEKLSLNLFLIATMFGIGLVANETFDGDGVGQLYLAILITTLIMSFLLNKIEQIVWSIILILVIIAARLFAVYEGENLYGLAEFLTIIAYTIILYGLVSFVSSINTKTQKLIEEENEKLQKIVKHIRKDTRQKKEIDDIEDDKRLDRLLVEKELSMAELKKENAQLKRKLSQKEKD